MYHFFVEQDQIGEQEISITGTDVNHIKNVLRMTIGETILISNGVDRDYVCKIASMDSNRVIAAIVRMEDEGTELPVKLYLFQGIPKGDKMELIIQKGVELGVYEIIPVETKRTVVKLDEKKKEGRLRRWQAVSESAAKQSKRLIIPEVGPIMTFQEALAFAKDFDLNLVPFEHARGMEKTREILSKIHPQMRVGIFIGPEGGFEDSEIALAENIQAKKITLGKRILRTETAGLAILSVIAFQTAIS